MKTTFSVLVAIPLLVALPAVAQQQPSPAKTIPDSINYMWKMVESDFTSLAEAMPEDKWNFNLMAPVMPAPTITTEKAMPKPKPNEIPGVDVESRIRVPSRPHACGAP